MLPKSVSLIQNERGQVIIMAPFAILFIVISTFFMLNIGRMANEKIRYQVAADAAARDGAYIQAMALGTIAKLNDVIRVADLLFDAGVAQEVKAGVEAGECADSYGLDVPACIAAVEDAIAGYKKMKKARNIVKNTVKAQKAVKTAMNVAIPIAVVAEARNNGATGATPIPSWDLKMKSRETGTWNPLEYALMKNVWKFESAKVKVLAFKWSEDGYAKNFFGGFKFPYYTATSAASPYCTSDSELTCDSSPANEWDASLVSFL